MQRVVVFIDYQNVYRRARGLYFDHKTDPHTHGQINPLALSEHLVQRKQGRILEKVFVYRGMPSSKNDPRGYAACRKQIASWQSDPRVECKQLPLRYPPLVPGRASKPEEKGIDVLLAIDFATLAYKNEYDIGILFSADTDLRPALGFVYDQSISAVPEVAAWGIKNSRGVFEGQRIGINGNQPFCNWLDKDDYFEVADLNNYNRIS